LSGIGGTGKKNESGKERDGTARGRRSEKGKESGRETRTKTKTKSVTAGLEKESETETETGNGSGSEVVNGPPNTSDPGDGGTTTHITS